MVSSIGRGRPLSEVFPQPGRRAEEVAAHADRLGGLDVFLAVVDEEDVIRFVLEGLLAPSIRLRTGFGVADAAGEGK